MPLVDLLAPPALDFGVRGATLGDVDAVVLVIQDYPPRVGQAWLSRLGTLAGVSVSVHLAPADPGELLRSINSSIQEYTSRLAMGGKALMRSRWEQSLADAVAMLKQIDQENQKVYSVTITVLVVGADKEELAQRVRAVEAACAGASMRARPAMFRQEDGLRAAGPWALLPPGIGALSGREMPAATVAEMYPWVSSGLNHGRGIILGRDEAGGIVLVDRRDAPDGSGIANPNLNVLGTSGGGKSYAAKVLLLREYALGARVLVLDPEREYRGLAQTLGGSIVDCGGGRGIINPLQVRGEDREDGEARGTRGPLASHLQRVKTFFQLYLPGLDDVERAALQDALLAAYREKGVDWQTDPESVQTWPTIADVQAGLPADSRLALLLRDAAAGSDSALWAGQTTVPPASDFTVFDIHALTDAADNVRRAQYFNILGYAWDLVREGRETGRTTLLVVDKAWILADPQTPQALGFLRDLSKRIRKYGGSLVVITQNVVDFLAPELARLGQPVIGNASTKLLMRQESKDLEALRDLLRLSEAECDRLTGARRGEGLLLAGNQHVWLRVEAERHEAEIIAAAEARQSGG